MPRARTRHWRFLILCFLLAIALLDAKLDPARKSITILWKPTSKLRIDDGLNAIERGIARLWKATPGDAGLRMTPVGTRNTPAKPRATTGKEGRARDPKALDTHSEEDRRRLDRAVSGN